MLKVNTYCIPILSKEVMGKLIQNISVQQIIQLILILI